MSTHILTIGVEALSPAEQEEYDACSPEDRVLWDRDRRTYSITCPDANGCSGWWECLEPHEVDGVSAADGPYECDVDAPWSERDEFTFHGVEHTWHYGHDWTVPYDGCIVQTADVDFSEFDHLPLGEHEVDDDWDDTSCYLTLIPTKEPA